MPIATFWDWITRSVSAALNWLTTIFNGLGDFKNLFIAVFGFAIVGTYIIWPLIAPDKGSDKAKKKKESES